MQIYYDEKCAYCRRLAKLVEKNTLDKDLVFINIGGSKYDNFAKETIVVVDKGGEYFYGESLRKIYTTMVFPYSLGKYVPVGILTLVYKFLREYRKY